MLQTSLLLALAVNGLFLLPRYIHYVLLPHRITKDGTELKNTLHAKPFTCVFCMAFWIAVVAGLLLFHFGEIGIVSFAVFPLATAFLATLINRFFHSLPISF